MALLSRIQDALGQDLFDEHTLLNIKRAILAVDSGLLCCLYKVSHDCSRVVSELWGHVLHRLVRIARVHSIILVV